MFFTHIPVVRYFHSNLMPITKRVICGLTHWYCNNRGPQLGVIFSSKCRKVITVFVRFPRVNRPLVKGNCEKNCHLTNTAGSIRRPNKLFAIIRTSVGSTKICIHARLFEKTLGLGPTSHGHAGQERAHHMINTTLERVYSPVADSDTYIIK